MTNRTGLAILLAATAAAGPACQCAAVIASASNSTLLIQTPANDQTFSIADTVPFVALASNGGGIKTVSLYGGVEGSTTCSASAPCAGSGVCTEGGFCLGTQFKVCKGATMYSSPLSCDFDVALSSIDPSLIVDGKLTLTAVAVDYRSRDITAKVVINVEPLGPADSGPEDAGPQDSGPPDSGPPDAGPPDSGPPDAGPMDAGPGLTIVFTQPTVSPGTNPPVADVAGVTPVAVAVTNNFPLTSVVITFDMGMPLTSWTTAPVTGPNFQNFINWEMTCGAGMHLLTAVATDSAGNTATAYLEIDIGGPTIVFTAPTVTPGTNPATADVEGTSPVAVSVTSFLPLTSVVITYDMVTTPLASWTAAPVTGPNFTQPVNWNGTLGVGMHTLTAVATDNSGQQASAVLLVEVGAPTIVFTEPTITAGTNPPVAEVGGTSLVEVAVTTLFPLASVVITHDGGQSLASWTNSPLLGTTFSQMVMWQSLGVGTHLLTAVATDSTGMTAQAQLTIDVVMPQIAFIEPTITAGTNPPVADVFGTSLLEVGVTTFLPLTSVVITYDNVAAPLATWSNNQGPTFSQMQNWVSLGIGPHTLTAVATDNAGEIGAASLKIVVEGPSIVFTAPPITLGSNPQVANVSAPSDVAVSVTYQLPLTSVVITYGGGTVLASWTTAPVLGPNFSKQETWATTPGVGTFVLTATATENDGETATAQLTIVVANPKCTSDASCPTGERCCTNDGTCNPTVHAGGTCSCDEPCPSDEGCFPGVCGQTPSQCYAGCDPGCQPGVPNQPAGCSAYPLGKLPAACMPVNGQPAFCDLLPANQQTAANKGGACIQGDNCSVTTQNCPDMPLDRSLPQAANNPLVKYNCVPVYPGVNGCYPAGTYTAGQTNCSQLCGSVSTGTAATTSYCVAGYECVQPVGANGPLGPAECEFQCANPTASGNASSECNAVGSQYTCNGVYEPYGDLMLNFSTGSCCGISGASCSVASDCCSARCRSSGRCE